MAPPSKRQKTDEEPKVIDIATQSDLTLIVGDGITHKKVNFEVERSALRRASPVFNSMLDPNKPYKEGSAKEVPLPEDDPEAMEVLLRIAHLLFPTIPSTFDYQSLAAIAVLCDKYDCAEVVEPFTHSSFETLKPLVSESSCEAIEVLFAAWTFGDRATFEITMPDIILGSAVSDNKLLCYNGSESYLSICQRQLPQEVIDYVEKKRQHSFHLLSREFEKITESLSCGKGCDDEASDEADKRRCCLLQLGYIMAPLTYACPNLISSGLGEDECLEDYYEACEGAVAECYGLHSECWPSEFGEKVAELKKKIPTGLEIPIGHERRQRGQEI